ncbi:MAG TPA: CvpA family protein, partial [Desulfurivibrionaceae bacterium]|nr:CvpA family protein [Desulfurivibrionaceae bacterium]
TMLGGFDRLLGGVFGLAKGVFLATLLFMAVAGIMSESAEYLRRSFSYPYLSSSAKALSWFIRDQEMRNRLRPKEPAISNLLNKAATLVPAKPKAAPAKVAAQPLPPPAPRYQPANRAGETPKK